MVIDCFCGSPNLLILPTPCVQMLFAGVPWRKFTWQSHATSTDKWYVTSECTYT